jgi:RimJ/RimL family protein N-acetyltransferase
MQILETDRLILRQLTLDDTDDLAEVLSDPQAMRYYPAPFTREQTIGWIEWNLHNYMQSVFPTWRGCLVGSTHVRTPL